MYIDIHCHLLPGVDDGVKTIEETLNELRRYRENDITDVIFTPHVNHPSIKTDITNIKEVYQKVKEKIENEIDLRTYLASELYLTPDYKDFIPFNSFVLIEFPIQPMPIYVLDSIFNLQLDGYEVILVHVERYKWLYESKDIIQRMREMGVLFQVNFEGLKTQEGKYYYDNYLVDFLATDNHGSSNREEVDLSLFKKYSEITKNAFDILGINS